MPTILADVNILGQVQHVARLIEASSWRDLWDGLSMRLLAFEDIGLSPEASDAEVWRRCQEQQIVLITANRNADGPDSLQAIIEKYNTADSLPVLTLGKSQEVMRNREYAEAVVERLLDIMMRLEELRGTGRLYLP